MDDRLRGVNQPGQERSRNIIRNQQVRDPEEAVDDNLLANKVKMALYADKQVRGRQMTVEASQGVIQLRGVAASPTEAQRAVQIAQGIKGVKEVRNRLTVQ